jgi:hypothetical protein
MRYTYLRSKKAVVCNGVTICRVDADPEGEMIASALNATLEGAAEVDGITVQPMEFACEKSLLVRIGANEYERYAALPQALSYGGAIYGKRGWNSDTGKVYYHASQPVAVPAS